MTQEISVLTGLVALTMLFGISILIFYYKWEGFMKKVLQINKEVRTEMGYVDEPVSSVPKKPLAERFYLAGGPVVLALAVLIPVMYFLLRTLLFIGKVDSMKGGVTGFVIILFVLITIVVGVLGMYEKNPKRRFWMELFPTIALEALLVLSLVIELNFNNGHHTGRHSAIEGYAMILACFFAYAVKSCRNWKRMISPEEKEKTE